MCVCVPLAIPPPQVLKGTGGEIVLPCLPIITGLTPRCWVISNDGLLVAVGYEEGAIQVSACVCVCVCDVVCMQVFALSESEGGEWAVCEVWKLEDAHDSNVLKIYFSPKNNKFISCSNSHHKVSTFCIRYTPV